MPDKSLVTSLSVRVQDAVGPLRELATAAQSSDAALAAMANSAADGLEELSTKGAKAFERLADGGKVSDATFNTLARTVDDVRQQVIAKFGAMENAPEPLQRSVKTAEQYMRDLSAEMARSAERSAELKEEFSQTAEVLDESIAIIDATADALKAIAESEARAAELAEEVAKKFGDIPEQIEEIQSAGDKTFKAQIKQLESVADKLRDAEKEYKKLGPEGEQALARIRAESARVESAMEQLAQEAKSSTGQIRDGFVRTGAAFETFTQTLTENPKEALEQLPKLAGAVIQLRNAIHTAQDAGAPVDDATLAKLRQFEQRLTSAGAEAKELKKDIDKATAGITGSADQWRGFDDIIQGLAGKFGKLGVGVLGAFAALKEGWAIGKEIAAAMGTDFGAMESAADSLKTALGTVTNALTTDGFVAAWHQAIAVVSNAGDTVLNSGKALEAYNQIVQSGVDRAEALKISQDDLRRIHGIHALAVQGGKEAMLLWNEQLKIAAEYGVGGLATALDHLKGKFEALKVAYKEWLENESRRQTATKNTIDALNAELDRLEALRIARQLGIDQLDVEILARKNYVEALEASKTEADLATKVQGGLSDSMERELRQIQALLPEHEKHRSAIERFAEALGRDVDVYRGGLAPEQEKQLASLAKLIQQYESLDPVQRGDVQRRIEQTLSFREAATAAGEHAAKIELVDGKYTNVAESSVRATAKLGEGKVAISNVGDAAEKTAKQVDDLAGGLIKIGDREIPIKGFHDALSSGGGVIAAYTGEIGRLNDELATLVGNLKNAAELALGLKRATDEAAGDESESAYGPFTPFDPRSPGGGKVTIYR